MEEKDTNKSKRSKYITKKSIELDNLLEAAREYTFQYAPKAVNLKRDKKDVEDITKGCCLFPNLYLNNNDSCIKCEIYENCACRLKNLGKKKRNE